MVAQRRPVFSEDMRRDALLVVQLQEWLMSLDESNYDTILDSILHSTFISTPARVEQLEQNLITAVTYRSPNLPIYARLTRDLVTCAGPNNSLGLFKGLILRTLHLFLDGEIIFPIECVDLPFIYQLTKAGVLTVPEAVATLAEYANDTAMSCISLCWIFVWFAPEIEQLNPDLFLLLTAILTAESSTDSLYPAFQDFVLALPELSENEWKLLRERREGHNPLSLHYILRGDKLDELRNLAAHPNFDVNTPVRSSIFEPSAILFDDPPMVCYAAFYGAVKCCQFLILEGADLTKTDARGRTLAQFAVAGGHIKSVRVVDSYNCDFTDTIECAAEYHHSEILQWLHQNKANSGPRSGLMIHTAAYSNNVKHVMYCLSHGVNVNLPNENNKTPLHIAAEGGFLDVLNLLLSQPDIDVNASDLCSQTPLHLAAVFGRTFSVRLLLSHPKINVNCRDKWGKTPLHWAASRGHADVIVELLRMDGINVNVRDKRGDTPLQHVIGTRYTDALKVLQGDSRVYIPKGGFKDKDGHNDVNSCRHMAIMDLEKKTIGTL